MWRTLRDDDAGAVAVLVALMLVVLIGFGALAVDVGYWYTSKRQLQSAADAAALAGCHDLILGADNAAVWATVEDYADRNFGTPLEIGECSVVPLSPGGPSDIGPRYVKVTVESDSPSILFRVLDHNRTTIRAQSIARIGYLSGARSPMPWGLPILRATRVEAETNAGSADLANLGDGNWQGNLPAGSVGSVDVIAYNDQTLDSAYREGVPERVSDVTRVVRIPDASMVTGIQLARRSGATEYPNSVMFTSGAGEYVVVYVTLAQPLPIGQKLFIVHGHGDHEMSQVTTTLYRVQFAAPATDDLYMTQTFSLERKRGGQVEEEVAPAGGFAVRRATLPIRDVFLQPSALTSTTVGSPQITIELNDYEYGRRYEMKVIGGATEVGNYMAVDFHTLRHTPYWQHPQDPYEYPSMPSGTQDNYYPYIAGIADFPFVMHIGDAVWTQPGNMSGPSTRDALEYRIGTEPSDFAGWVAAGKPESRRLVLVPIVEKIQETTGATPLRVVSFGTFYIESFTGTGGGTEVIGRFVEYAAPGFDIVDDPPGPIAVEAVHLVSEGLDF